MIMLSALYLGVSIFWCFLLIKDTSSCARSTGNALKLMEVHLKGRLGKV